jgi:hypothetical protein
LFKDTNHIPETKNEEKHQNFQKSPSQKNGSLAEDLTATPNPHDSPNANVNQQDYLVGN